MRITNQIMQNNNLANININKIYQDKLSNQMSTKKKISRPSDDPVVAIRALRLRSNVTEISQFYDKNIPDAEQWLSITEDALGNLTEIITNMIGQYTKGANTYLTSSDREILLEELKELKDEIYKTGDVDYAGRYIFTGYRTDTSLSFTTSETKPYSITEQLNASAMDTVTVIKTGNLDSEVNVSAVEVHRIRLAYNDCIDSKPTLAYQEKQADGSYQQKEIDVEVVSQHEDPYTVIANVPEGEERAIYVPETGEILLSDAAYQKLYATSDDPTTKENEGEIRITYEKSNWQKGDLRPEHYFYCKSDQGTDNEIEYNSTYLDGDVQKQIIEYDVGANQTIRVNSTADECFSHGIGREVDDLFNALEELTSMEDEVARLNAELESATGNEIEAAQKKLDAAQKALDLTKGKVQSMFESGISAMQGYLDKANLCVTQCGTRSSKLALIESRMKNQKTTFETVKSENEDIDITEVALQLQSASLTYEAALMAIGKITQNSLLNFI